MLRLITGLFVAMFALAQNSFDVAEVKVNRSGVPQSSGDISNGRLVVNNAPLRLLISEAWSLPIADIVGPSYLDDVRVDVVAKAPSPTTPDRDVRRMLQELLKERMKLQVHTDNRVESAYALTVWKGQHKMMPSTMPEKPEDSRCTFQNSGSVAHAHCMHMTMPRLIRELAEFATGYLDRPLVDQTGIQGAWELDLEWTPLARVEAEGGLTLPAALQAQAGLQIETKKLAMPILVVDAIERTVADN